MPLIMLSIIGVNSFGLFLFLGLVSAVLITVKASTWLDMSRQASVFLAVRIILSGLTASMGLYGLENIGYFSLAPHKALYVWDYGMSLWGGIFGGLIALAWSLRQDRIRKWKAATIACWAFLVGSGVCRVGDLVTGGSIGTNDQSLVSDAHSVFSGTSVVAESVATHPGAVYEMLLVFLLFCILVKLRGWSAPPWGRFVVMLGGYAAGTLLVRVFRSDPNLLYLQSAQWISVGVLLIIGCFLGVIFLRSRRQRHKVVDKEP